MIIKSLSFVFKHFELLDTIQIKNYFYSFQDEGIKQS